MNPSLTDIKDATCAYYKDHRITRADIDGQSRAFHISRPRQVAMYLARALTTHSLPRIAKSFGNRHHTTALHSLRAVERRDQCLSDAEAIRKVLEARTSPWDDLAIELRACRAIGEFLCSLPPRVVERDWLNLAVTDCV